MNGNSSCSAWGQTSPPVTQKRSDSIRRGRTRWRSSIAANMKDRPRTQLPRWASIASSTASASKRSSSTIGVPWWMPVRKVKSPVPCTMGQLMTMTSPVSMPNRANPSSAIAVRVAGVWGSARDCGALRRRRGVADAGVLLRLALVYGGTG